MENNIQFSDYDRIADTLMWLGSSTYQLQFVLSMAHKDRGGNRRFFHTENTYGSRYPGVYDAHSIRREMNYYFCISDIKVFASGIILAPRDVFALLNIIETKIFPWYYGKNSVYKIIKDGDLDRLQIVGKYTPAYFPKDDKFIRFEPIVYRLENNMYMQGTRMFINTDENFVDLTLDSFTGFYYILKNTDMYSAACNLATYVKTKPYGINNWQQAGLGSGGGNIQDNYNSNQQRNIDSSSNSKGNNFLSNARSKKGNN